MRYRLFQFPLPAPPELEELNVFLGTQRVATVTQHLVQTAGGAMLVFVVETVGASPARPAGATVPKIDYRDQLSAADFAVFSRLREERKKWGEAEGLPVYTVFTNAQLAEMVRRRVRTGRVTSRRDIARIARRFNAGTRRAMDSSPEGTAEAIHAHHLPRFGIRCAFAGHPRRSRLVGIPGLHPWHRAV